MPRASFLALIAILLLPACSGKLGGPPPAPVHGGTYSRSVGFTGLAGDPTQYRHNSPRLAAFARQVPSLTGCSPNGAGYGYGANRAAPTGIAIPLTCG